MIILFFLPHPSSPARRGSTSPSAPSPQEREPTGKPAVLYSQTSFNCVDSRLHSAEHSNEFDALLSLAREFAHKGLLVNCLRNRIAIVLRNRVAIVLRTICECLTHDVRLFMRRWRPFGSVIDDKIGGI